MVDPCTPSPDTAPLPARDALHLVRSRARLYSRTAVVSLYGMVGLQLAGSIPSVAIICGILFLVASVVGFFYARRWHEFEPNPESRYWLCLSGMETGLIALLFVAALLMPTT